MVGYRDTIRVLIRYPQDSQWGDIRGNTSRPIRQRLFAFDSTRAPTTSRKLTFSFTKDSQCGVSVPTQRYRRDPTRRNHALLRLRQDDSTSSTRSPLLLGPSSVLVTGSNGTFARLVVPSCVTFPD